MSSSSLPPFEDPEFAALDEPATGGSHHGETAEGALGSADASATAVAEPPPGASPVVEESLPDSGQFRAINPVISTAAVGELDSFVPRTAAASHVDPSNTAAIEAASLDLLASVPNSPLTVLRTALPLVMTDVVALVVCFLFATVFMVSVTGWLVAWTFVYQFLAISTVYFAVAIVFGLYPGSGVSPPAEMRQQVTAVIVSFLVLLTLDSLFGTLSKGEAVSVLAGGLLSMLVLPVARFFARELLGRRAWWGERAILVGAGRQTEHLASFLKRCPQRGLRPVGLVDAPHRYWRSQEDPLSAAADSSLAYLGSPDELSEIAERHQATWAIVSIGGRDPEEVAELLTRCSLMPNLLVLPSRTMLPSLWTRSRECGGLAGMHIKDQLLSPVPRAVKRLLDVGISSVALVGLLPFFLFVVATIKIVSPGPAFFGHTRIGRGGRRFPAWKFRTMVPDADKVLAETLASDPALAAEWERDQKLKNDPRIVPKVGQFLRKTSLDELPQLWNVLRGQMTLVGPRPIVEDEIPRYEEVYPLYLRVRPGVTGLWQISGRNNTSYAERVRLDTYYVRNWSPWLDLYILLRTVRTMVLREGAY